MRDWVRQDLGARAQLSRDDIRWAIPCVLVLARFWLIPTTLVCALEYEVPIFAPYVMFSHALDKVWRRHRLSQRGLDPISREYKRSRDAHIHRAYIERYGPAITTFARADSERHLVVHVCANPVSRTCL